jgi:hypothetical protein
MRGASRSTRLPRVMDTNIAERRKGRLTFMAY